MLDKILLKNGCKEVTAMDVYTDIFRLGSGFIQKSGEDGKDFKGNPLAYFRNGNEENGHYRILLEDTFEDTLRVLQEADFAIVNGISYLGRKNTQNRATKMFALIFDVDGVTDDNLENFFSGMNFRDEKKGIYTYPEPNYVILSGHGVHLYYVFDEPIALYPYTKVQLKELKYAITRRIWNGYTSTEEKPQYQGINQGFRIVGGKTKVDGVRVRAFRYRREHTNVQELSLFVPKESRIEQLQLFKESKYTLAEAKKKFPEWYESVVVQGRKAEYWDLGAKVHGDNPYAIVNWWTNKIQGEGGATFGHRYFCVMCMAIYAIKCRMPFEQLKTVAYELIPFLNDINPKEPFTEKDVDSALECYDLRYCKFPIKDIVKLSAVEIAKNKRNGRKQKVHLARARLVQTVDYPNGSWRNKDGRPMGSGTKEDMVLEYKSNHPNASVTEIAKALGVSRTTVYKWLKNNL